MDFGKQNNTDCSSGSFRLRNHHDVPSEEDDLSFPDLEKTINDLLDDRLENDRTTKTLKEFFVEERKNYLLQVSSCLEETKTNFIKFNESLNKNVEDMMRRLGRCIQAREQELKWQLEEIKREKVSKWERQLSLCRENLRKLHKMAADSSGICSTESLALDFNSHVEQDPPELEFIDAGDAKFEADNYSKILENVKSLGKITVCGSEWKAWRECGPRGNLTNIKPKFVMGGRGSGPGQFCRPWGACCDATGRILICDRSNHRIQVFSGSGEYLMAFGKEGTKSGEFNTPSGIDVDVKCRIVVADKDNHRIQVFTYSGGFIHKFGGLGTMPGQFEYPWDVSVNENCDIAVSDSKNHRIQLFDDRGRFVTLLDAAKIGAMNPRMGLKLLDSPRGLAFRPDGSLLATDFNNHRVLLINKDLSRMWTFGGEGCDLKEFFRPQGIACDRYGRFAVADSKNYRVQVFDPRGNVVQCFGNQGTKPGQFDCPLGISFHPNQNIVVVDFNNNRVQVF